MIKGCAKRVVVVKDIDSNFFEEAFFIVKQGQARAKHTERDYLNEANRIVHSDLAPPQNCGITVKLTQREDLAVFGKRQQKSLNAKLRDALMFTFGFGISAVFCTLIYYAGILP